MLSAPQFINTLATQQDFFWFFAILAWLGVVAWAYREREGRRIPPWLIYLGVAQVFYALASLVMIVVPHANEQAALWSDVLLALPTFLAVGALGFGAWRKTGRWLAGGAMIALVFLRYLTPQWTFRATTDVVARVAYWRDLGPEQTSGLLALLSLIAGWRILRLRAAGPHPRLWRTSVALSALLPLASAAGPVAFWIHEAQMFTPLSRVGLPGAGLVLVAGLSWLGVCLAPTVATAAVNKETATEAKRFLIGLLCWLPMGFGLTALSGHFARVSFEQGLLSQVRMGATLIDSRAVAACLVPELKLGPAIVSTSSEGSLYAEAPFLTSARVASLRAALGVVHRSVPSASWAHLITHREGYVLTLLFDEDFARRNRFVPIHHPIEPADLIAWADRAEAVGLVLHWGARISARVPILGPNRQMLGWLGVDVPIATWSLAQAQSRFQALLLTGAGVVFAALVFGLRLRGRVQRLAEEAAVTARKAEQMQAVFLAKVSHELRTPVQNILGYTQLLRPEDGETRGQIEAVHSQGRLLIRLVNDLIDLSAAQTGAFRLQSRPARLLPVIKESVDAMRSRAAAKGLALEVDLACPDGELALCDPERLKQVVTNLVGNAIKFTQAGWVRVALAPIATVGDEQTYQLIVSDSGPGISRADQMSLFRPFERLKAGGEIEGSGLGLALTRMICLAMRGSLEVASDGRQGSTFTARFVVTSIPATTPTGSRSPSVTLPARSRVLIADDNTLVRQLFRAWLEQAGASVTEAADGWDAYRQIEASPPDVLLADLSMPGLDGIALTQRLRGAGHARSKLRIVGVSAHAGAAEREAALAAEMDDFLLKPVEAHDLLLAIGGTSDPKPTTAEVRGRFNELMRSLRRTFAAEAPAQLAELKKALAAGDDPRVARVAHSLGNAAFALNDRALGDAAAALESAARSGSPNLVDLAAQVAAAMHAVLEEPFMSVPTTDAENQ